MSAATVTAPVVSVIQVGIAVIGGPLLYGKPQFRNPFFIAGGPLELVPLPA